MNTPTAEDTTQASLLSEAGRARLLELLFGTPDQSTYAVLDAARLPGLVERLQTAPEESACLYRGELEPDLRDHAPYLVKLRPPSAFTDWLLDQQWGNSAGIFAITPVGLEALRRHFRGFLRVRDHTGKVLYFRWYDPRVLRAYLPTCNAQEIKTVYGPVSRYVCEDKSPARAVEFPVERMRITPRTFVL